MKRAATVLLMLIMCPAICYGGRAGKVEVYAVSAEGNIHFDTGLPDWERCGSESANTRYDVLGLGIGYNISNRWNVGIEYAEGNGGIKEIDRNGLAYTAKAEYWCLTAIADYYFSDSGLTPFISGGLGVTGARARRNPCMHNSDFRIINDDYYAYEIGAGLRWDINAALFLKTGYRYRASILSNEKHHADYLFLVVGIKF